VARAKTTARAEARRRYRQAGGAEGEPVAESTGSGTTPAGAPARPAAPARPGIGAAFRGAYRPANLREDLGYLPRLVVGRAVLGSIALIVAGAVLIMVQPTGALASFAFQTVILPPALAPVFIVGFFAPRASYLLGLLIGLFDAVVYGAVVASVLPQLAPGQDPTGQVMVALLTSPLSGLLFAAAAAWYRRFLALSGPGPRQRAAAKPGAKSARSDGRTRAGAAKK
jgi:hypothetical protein